MKRKHISAACALLLVLAGLQVGCSSVAKLQVRGTEEAMKLPVSLGQLEEADCEIGEDVDACRLWDRSIERLEHDSEKFSVGVIEFNDEGQANPIQREQVMGLIREAVGERQGSRNNPTALVVMFAHGWHHGAQVCDSNLACFRRVLARLQKNQPDLPVVGVYLGWRGEQYRRLNPLTLFTRKLVAQRIGRRGGLETLLMIDDLCREKSARLVTVGHSLGGALVFTAVQSKLMVQVQGRKDKDSPARWQRSVRPLVSRDLERRGFGDMVVFVNPAVEAWEYEAFHRDIRDREGRPEVITVASTADKAMGGVFSASRVVQLLWRPNHLFRGGSNFVGLGRLARHQTHRLRWGGAAVSVAKPRDREKPCGCQYSTGSYDTAAEGSFDLRALPGKPKGEFIVAITDGSIIGGHNDIYNPRFVEFLARAVRGEVDWSRTGS